MSENSLSDMKTLKGEHNIHDETPVSNINMSIGDFVTVGPDNKNVIGRIDRYELIDKLGEGGFGAVYQATDSETGLDMALKVLPPLLTAVPGELDNVRENYALVSKLHHPHIASLLHLHKVQNADNASQKLLRVSKDSYLVVMECVNGSILSDWRKKFPQRKVDFDKAIEICSQTADALDFAHEQSIVHRDIKPHNIMIQPNGKIKVLDFGLAAQIRSSMSRVSQDQGETSGTRPYMAPEQWCGNKQGAYTDQYALSVMFYELIYGEVPFQSVFETGDTGLMLNCVENREPRAPEELTKKQWNALKVGLSKNPSERYASCGDLISSIGGGKAKTISPQKARNTQKGGYGKNLATLVVLGVLGIGGYFGYKSYEESQQGEAEHARIEQIESDKRVQLTKIISQAEAALKVQRYADASELVRKGRAIDRNNPQVKEMADKINLAAGLEQVVPLKSKAEIVVGKLSRIDNGDGFENLKDGIQTQLASAKTFFDTENYGKSMGAYGAVLDKCESLFALDKQRRDAIASRDKSASAKRTAESDNADTDAVALFNGGVTLQQKAASKFGDRSVAIEEHFKRASELWVASVKEFEKSSLFAKGTQSVKSAEESYKRELRSVARMNDGLSGFESFMNTWGDSDWSALKQRLGRAGISTRSEKWTEAVAQYTQAKSDLSSVVSTAVSAKQSDDRRREQARLAQAERERKQHEAAALALKKSAAIDAYTSVLSKATSLYKSALSNKEYDKKGARSSCDSAISLLSGLDTDYLDYSQKSTINQQLSTINQLAKSIKIAPNKGENWTVPGLDMYFVYVENGSFQMGSNSGDADEKPVHRVTISKPFWMGKYEVTSTQFRLHTSTKYLGYPQASITWFNAVTFCKRLTQRERIAARLPEGYEYRLPTEAEWEFAARGGNKSRGYKHAGSDDINPVAWYQQNSAGTYSRAKSHTPGNKQPNELGIFDMSGNLEEWCLDKADKFRRKVQTNTYKDGAVDPLSTWGSGHITRGGYWYSSEKDCRTTSRSTSDYSISLGTSLGFRVALAPIIK